jgi:hypothetical protein
MFQLDGKIPNIALMRLASHHRELGDEIDFRWTGSPRRELWDNPDKVYGSAIFEKTRPIADRLREEFPEAVIGGTGIDFAITLESVGVTTLKQDYSIYPKWKQSIGFTQRGCRLACSFCVVPRKEGAWRFEQSIKDIWRGGEYPRELILLDNDFFGNPRGEKDNQPWRDLIKEIREGGFKVSFNQGINARFLTDESAEAISSVDYRDDSMKVKRIYTAWDNRKDEQRLFDGLNLLVKYGVKPDHIMVYMLIGYWPGETQSDRLYRQQKLRDFGCRPYPMPFVRTRELVGFQRWVIGAYDKRMTWAEWEAADYRPDRVYAARSVPQTLVATTQPVAQGFNPKTKRQWNKTRDKQERIMNENKSDQYRRCPACDGQGTQYSTKSGMREECPMCEGEGKIMRKEAREKPNWFNALRASEGAKS